MSIEYMLQAMKSRVGSSSRKLVLIKLADNANDNGECYPSYQNIADHCEMTRRSVMSHIRKLTEDGFVQVEHRKTAKGNSSNIFKLISDKDRLTLPSENISPPSENISPPPSENISPRTSHSSNQSINLEIDKEINHVALDDFIESRKQMKKPMTKLAIKRLKNVLKELNHEDQAYLIDQSIACGWTTIYPEQLEKRDGKNTNNRTVHTGAAGRAADGHDFLKREYEKAIAEEQAGETVQQVSHNLRPPMEQSVSNG